MTFLDLHLARVDAPQLSVELWSPAPEEKNFAAACAAVEQAGVRPTRVSKGHLTELFEVVVP